MPHNIKKQWINAFCVSLLFLHHTAYAMNVVKSISNINGLSNNAVNCIYEDSEHILWFGTWDGLNAYNGRDLKTFHNNRNDISSISNNIIRQILEQNRKYLWIATDYGINRWDRESREFLRYYAGTENKIPKQERSYILGITTDKRIICFVKGGGLFRFDEVLNDFVSIPSPEGFADSLKDFVIDENNRLYALLHNGNVVYANPNEDDSFMHPENLQLPGKPGGVEKIFYTNGSLVVCKKQELFVFGRNHSLPERIALDIRKNVSQVICRYDKLYIGFYEGGCIEYSLFHKSYQWIGKVPEKMSVFSLCYASQDILWVGSDGQGVLQLYHYDFPFVTVWTDHPVRCFCRDNQGRILIGTKGGGIKRLERENGRISNGFTLEKGLISNSVYALAKNRSGDIFIGTEGEGINILYAGSSELKKLDIPPHCPYFRAVYNIHFTNNDSLLWIGTSGFGLIKMAIRKNNRGYGVGETEQYISSGRVKPLHNDVVYTITSKEQTLWFGTRGGGVYKIDIEGNIIERIEDTNDDIRFTNNDILSLLSDRHQLWIGTSYGLNKLTLEHNRMKLEHYDETNGLTNNTIHGILKDNNHSLWLSTNQGLTRISPKNEIRNFTLKDGLQNDEFSDGAYFKDPDNFLYFGGVSGFNYFNPQDIRLRGFAAPIALSGIRIYNTPQNMHERIRDNTLKLTYEERYVTFTFISKDFINNENCEYVYRLRGYADEWSLPGNNPNIVFSKLPPGKYRLEVKNTNGDKQWTGHVYRLRIQVGYPWWLGAPALATYGVLLLVVGCVTHSVVRNRIRLNRQILIEQIEIQSQQKAYESKLNFFTHVAHEFFTPLTLIFGGAEHLLERAEMNVYTRKYLQIIRNNAERMQKLINELMEFRKAKSGFTPLCGEHIDLGVLAGYVSDNYLEGLHENKIDFRMNLHGVSSLYSDRNSLEKIFFNLFSNAFKYTPRNGYIHVEIRQGERNNPALHFIIRNSGKGLTERQMDEIFDKYRIFDASPNVGNAVSTGLGLNLTKSLVELLGGRIRVRSLLGEYVEFDVVIPPLEFMEENIPGREEDPTTTPGGESPAHSPAFGERGVRVLVVDDEKHIRSLLKDILSPRYTVGEASGAQEALELIRDNHPDVIISDIRMPAMDGIALIDVLKSNAKTGYIPVIGLSAKTSVDDLVEAYAHGADIYITKPFHPKHIISAIENLLSKHTLLQEYFNSGRSCVKIRDGAEIHREDERLMQEIADYVRRHIDDESLSPIAIAGFMNISKATLYRRLKELTGKTPSEFVRAIRLEYASKLLTKTKLTVSEVMYRCGFANKSYFYREFQKLYGTSPKDYRLANRSHES
ncbi:MAG: response regulator [Tannerellaceae bacterium]|jgi:signal transduction histidine kinase/AraC-like DNA-binding protein/ligand-binding sensor domain-containing protein|nr:response regulator [Tannerellaceae bacterium]